MTDRIRPTHSQLMLPLLQTIEELGGEARPKEVYSAIAERMRIPDDVRNETTDAGGQTVNVFERHIRWARQTAVRKGLIDNSRRGARQHRDIDCRVAHEIGKRKAGNDLPVSCTLRPYGLISFN